MKVATQSKNSCSLGQIFAPFPDINLERQLATVIFYGRTSNQERSLAHRSHLGPSKIGTEGRVQHV